MGKEDEQYQNLIPGLPDEIAFDCLLRLPYCYHSPLKSVCRKWKSLLSRHSFYAQRRLAAKGEDFVCLVQALVAPDSQQPKQTAAKTQNPLLYGLTLYNATHDTWRRLPETPLLPDGIPMFSQCVAVAGKLVVVGGWDPSTLDSVADVYVYDFVGGGGWARGASLSTARSFFACAAVGPFVFVAGGHDNQKNALKSAELYDPNTDTWQPLPDMAEERDECHGFPSGDGRFFWVMSGYGTDSQGQFGSSAEFYDSARGEWTRVDGVWPYPNRGPGASTCLPPRENRKHEMTEVPFPGLWCVDAGGDVGGHARGVREYDIREGQWKLVGPIPEGTRSSPCVALIEGAGSPSDRIFVIGSGYMDGGDMKHVAYLWDTQSKGWTHVDAPVGFSGFVFSACSIHL